MKVTYSSYLVLFILSLPIACDENKNKNNEENQQNSSSCPNCGPQAGVLAINATADLTNAFGLLAIDNQNSTALALAKSHNETVIKLGLKAPLFETNEDGLTLTQQTRRGDQFTIDGKSFIFPRKQTRLLAEPEVTMQKIDEDTQEIKDALTQDVRENSVFDPNMKLPKLLTIAVSPTKEIYLHFEKSFIYKDAISTDDPWNPSNGYQCQIFRVKGGTLDDLLTNTPSHNNLECIDNTHFIDPWRVFANGVFQFDDTGNVYYPGSIPNTSKMVVYKQAKDGSSITEMINANICVQNFFITHSGGVFYTGQTCQNNQGGGGGGNGGFFRYINPGTDGNIVEITRDWWNFVFDTSQNSNKADTAVFFGPDPRNATTASWDSACLFKFDPSQTDPQTRISDIITCGNNINDWLELRRSVDVKTYGEGFNNYTGTDKNHTPSLNWKKEFGRRCTSKDEVFAGGGSQISFVKQDSANDIYVIGNIRKKIEGNLRCSVEVRGPHCVINGMPIASPSSGTAYTASTCAADSGTWINKGRCSDGSTDASCIAHSRTWTPGFCSNSTYVTQATCTANSGVWQTGRCSNNTYTSQSTCESNSATWTVDTWAGSCESTDTNDNAKLHNNDKRSCIPEWATDTVWYENVTNKTCTSAETGTRSTWHEWDSKDNNFAQTASSTRSAYTDLSFKYLVNRMDCFQEASNGNMNWTTEYSSLAKVDADAKSLKLISLPSEKAINLWIVNDKPYYSSFDTSLGQYLLSGLQTQDSCIDTKKTQSACTSPLTWTERQCVNSSMTTKQTCEDAGLTWRTLHPVQIISNFETYNLVESGSDGEMFADGLDFSANQYKFGTINIANKSISLKQGLTGTVKTIIILPKD